MRRGIDALGSRRHRAPERYDERGALLDDVRAFLREIQPYLMARHAGHASGLCARIDAVLEPYSKGGPHAHR